MKKKIKLLAIGNSFSEDAMYYLHDIAKNVGIDTHIVNLYVPGCSLEQHMTYLKNDEAPYRYELNGHYLFNEEEFKYVSLKEVMQEKWNHIIIQQASHDSGIIETYYPYASQLASYLRERQPHANLWLNQTWEYEKNSPHPAFLRYKRDPDIMYEELTNCYLKVAEELNLELIPTGEVLHPFNHTSSQALSGIRLYRDGYHLSFLDGRYVAGLVWAKTILAINLADVTYEPVSRYTNVQAKRLWIDEIKETIDKLL